MHLQWLKLDTNILDNKIVNNGIGIHVTDSSSLNKIIDNNVSGNQIGIVIDDGSASNSIYHNLFNNTENVFNSEINNQWDNGYHDGYYPDGGNYWSDYDGVDEFSGPDQDQPGRDHVGDTPYVISDDPLVVDQYPLMDQIRHCMMRGL